jgi:hypothetical protein
MPLIINIESATGKGTAILISADIFPLEFFPFNYLKYTETGFNRD